MPLPQPDAWDAIERLASEVGRSAPSEREVELRKQYRAGLRVERAVNQPGGRPAPVTAAVAAKEQP